MKYLLLAAFSIISTDLYSQVISIETFVSLFGKEVSYIDDVLSKNYKVVLDEINQEKGTFTWKKGFNLDHSKNNEFITYSKQDSVQQFIYTFPPDKYNDVHTKTYDDFFENEFKKSNYKRLKDTIEDLGEHKALVKNYEYDIYIIKKYKIASVNGCILKIIKM